ncbi:Rep [uncultured virus]|uniref:Rep n=1 Tax=uncultured virus TaxID=340016 RepID=A0A2K9LSP0_9VIRU|nr:Rep [uncultured virus]
MEEVHEAFHGAEGAGPRQMSKRWMLTVFDDVWTPTFTEDMKYAVWQRERCPSTGRIHVHIYVRFVGKKRMSAVKNAFCRQDMHCEVARGSEAEATEYCEKEETRIEAGVRWKPANFDAAEGKQGRRSDLEAIAAKCKEGASIAAIAEAHPGDYIRYHAGINALHEQVAPKPPAAREVQVIVLWGATGTGKTHRIMTQFPECYPVIWGRDPWGHYQGEDCVLFDEFDWEKWSIQEMNRFLDKWRCLLDARYRNRYAAWTRVAICANSCPSSWWPNAPVLLLQSIRRRIATSCYKVLSKEQEIEDMEQTPTF